MKNFNLKTGQKIVLEGKEYTIIENIEGTKYKVLAKDCFKYFFDKNNDERYATSSIARYLDNDYYNSLPESIRNAIVETLIVQRAVCLIRGNEPIWCDMDKFASIHKVFVPSYDEVVKLYGPENLNLYGPKSCWTWLRDAYCGGYLLVSSYFLQWGRPCEDWNHYVRPAFVIDLSKVDFEVIIDLVTGQKIIIAGKEYTVIENVQGNQYKVLATDTFKHKFDACEDDYATSEIAYYLDNVYYNTSELNAIRDAIIETSIQQKALKEWIPIEWNAPKNAGTHKIFVPSWDELTKAAGGTDSTTLKIFLNSYHVWLRDTSVVLVLDVDSNGFLDRHFSGDSYYIRPAMVLDLSKVDFEIN